MTPPNPAARIAEIRERLEYLEPDDEWTVVDGKIYDRDGHSVCAPRAPLDRELIAHAPADLRWLTDELERVRSDLAAFDDEYVCPECKSYNAQEISYEDDFGSMRCGDCGYAGEPGEDFPTSRKIRDELARAEAERDEARAELERVRGALSEARGLAAECLALHPSVTGDMERVRVWSGVVARLRALAGREGE